MALETYRRKRDFQKTTEPSGEERTPRDRGRFVVQKHDARRLHYDLRLELDGVLKSWAVPKGPSLDPSTKSLAIEVEDHPIDYADFEGVIPQGEYGGGTVMVWDRGRWEPDGDPRAGLKRGRLKFQLRGEKLSGGWALVRMRPRDDEDEDKHQWLLRKLDDDAAVAEDRFDVREERPRSVLTGRDLPQIASDGGDRGPERRSDPKKAARAGKRRSAAPVKEPAEERSGNVVLTHPDKVLYPEQGITKADLARYYFENADRILPFVAERPLTLVRCPSGRAKKCFYQKHWTDSMPVPVKSVPIREKGSGELRNYVVIDSRDGLVALVQMGVLEMHPWGAKTDDLESPDLIVFDLDPGDGVEWSHLVRAAQVLRGILDSYELESFIRTSGGKGLHVVVPIVRRNSWDEVKAFARAIAESMAAEDPKHTIATATKSRRKGKIFVDYLRNDRGATSIATYSPRALPGAPVATPLRPDEMQSIGGSDAFRIENLQARLARLGKDPWEGFFKTRQWLSKSRLKKAGIA